MRQPDLEMTLQASPARRAEAIWFAHTVCHGTDATCRMDRGSMIGLAMFGDDQKTPPKEQPPAKSEDRSSETSREDADKDAYQFTDWALI